ncbi:MAG: MlaD family protein [Planctomycetota bacterium]|jgi:ABC-type transporter Mla subunit MlaD
MKQRTQNIAVGITVIVALLILGGLVLTFTGLPQVFQGGYEIKMEFPKRGDVRPGQIVYLFGMQVGRVTEIRFTDPDDPTKGVTFVARIDSDVRLPSNVKAQLFIRGMAGAPYLQLSAERKPDEAIEFLPTDKVTTLKGEEFPQRLSLPPEINEAFKDLSSTAKKADTLMDHLGPALENFSKLTDDLGPALKSFSKLMDDLGPALKSFSELADNLNAVLFEEPQAAAPAKGALTATTRPAEKPSAPTKQERMKATIAKLGKVIDGLNAIFGDAENQKNLKAALANFAKASEQAKEALKSLEAFSKEAGAAVSKVTTKGEDLMQKLMQNAEQLSRILTSLEKTLAKIEQGEGTAGMLLNDTELYNKLVNAAKMLTETLQEVRDLVKEWQASGVGIKLK